MAQTELENKAKILIIGNFGQDNIAVSVTDNAVPVITDLIRQSEKRWNPRWFPGSLSRVFDYGLSDNRLVLTLGQTNFKEYVGSRDLASLRRYGYRGISNPLSCSSSIITEDGKMIIAKKMLGDATGSIDAIGGYVHPEKDFDPQTGTIDIFKAAKREVLEEALITEEEIFDVKCLGLSYEYAELCHPVSSFVMNTHLYSRELQERIKGKEGEINLIVVEPEKVIGTENLNFVLNQLKNAHPNVEPDGRITIALSRMWAKGISYPNRLLRFPHQI